MKNKETIAARVVANCIKDTSCILASSIFMVHFFVAEWK